MIEFPLMLYRDGETLEWEGRKLATLIVHSAEEEAAAAKNGWQRIADFLSEAKLAIKRKRG